MGGALSGGLPSVGTEEAFSIPNELPELCLLARIAPRGPQVRPEQPMFAGARTRATRVVTLGRMQATLHAPSVFELSLGDYTTSGASICCNQDGTQFSFTIGPVTDVTVAALDSAAQRYGMISLYGCGMPLLLDLVSLERKEPNKLRIKGRVCGDTSDTVWAKRRFPV